MRIVKKNFRLKDIKRSLVGCDMDKKKQIFGFEVYEQAASSYMWFLLYLPLINIFAWFVSWPFIEGHFKSVNHYHGIFNMITTIVAIVILVQNNNKATEPVNKAHTLWLIRTWVYSILLSLLSIPLGVLMMIGFAINKVLGLLMVFISLVLLAALLLWGFYRFYVGFIRCLCGEEPRKDYYENHCVKKVIRVVE